MDNALIQLVARLKIRLRQVQNISLNTQRFFAEQTYAGQVLDLAEECEDVELVSIAMDLRDKLGWLTTPSSSDSTPKGPAKSSVTSAGAALQSQRYAFGARS
ncbi:hypothetical protein [Viridibacterium curvum]|uniref:Uncharacterized protein n=1 Tax=Viridibacterium curvum TaxID=1101404 RepID=A0ABP9Q9G5_9RHOO